VVFSEPVRAIVDSMARAGNQLPAANTDLMMKTRLATEVVYPSKLRVEMPPGWKAPPSGQCEMRPWPGQLAFSADDPMRDARCSYERMVDSVEHNGKQYDQFVVVLLPGEETPFPISLLKWRIKATSPGTEMTDFFNNPPPAFGTRRCGAVCWFFSTVTIDGEYIDAPEEVYSSPPPTEMAISVIMDRWPEGRNDRPGQDSRLIFRFQLGDKGPYKAGEILPAGQLELIGPSGTDIPIRCYALVETRVQNLFGSIFNASQLGVDLWDPAAMVTNCEGAGEFAVISIDAGLVSTKTYAFALRFRTPFLQPTENFWTMSFQEHFTAPMESYLLWQFPQIDLYSFAENSGPSCYMGECDGAGQYVAIPVKITVRTVNSIKTNGELQITAPMDFGFNATPGEELVEGDRPTECILKEYDPKNMSKPPYTWRFSERDCLIADRGMELDGSGTGDMRTVRVIMRYTKNEFDTRPPKEMSPDKLFTIDLWVHPPTSFRPPEEWHLESYEADGKGLDVGDQTGWEVRRTMKTFEHSNTGGVNELTMTAPLQVTAGLVYIPNFIIDWVLPANAWLHDKLVLTGPEGFLLQLQHMAPNSPGSCIERTMLLPPRVADIEPEATRPTVCRDHVMTFDLSNFGRALQSGELNRIKIELYNPESPPAPEKNYWKLEHYAGSGSKAMQTSAIAASWPVIPVLFNTASGITGTFKAAGSKTTISFDFQCVQSASELQIDALVPKGFLFQDAYATANVSGVMTVPQILVRSYDEIRLVVLAKRYDTIKLVISSVVLSEEPGVTQWRLSTWELPEEDMLGTPYIRDQVFMQGFLIPGLLKVVKATGQTGREAAAILQENSNLTFTLVSSAEILAGCDVQARVEGAGLAGFKLFGEAAELWLLDEEGEVEVEKIGEWFCKDQARVSEDGYMPFSGACTTDAETRSRMETLDYSNETLMNELEAAGRFADQIALKVHKTAPANRHMRLKLQVQNSQDRTTFLKERWYISATLFFSGTSVVELISTNDGAYVPLSVVTQLPTKPDPVPSHIAPLTRIEVTFELDPLDSGAEAYAITAPLGYTFYHPCKVPIEAEKLRTNPKEMRCLALPDSEEGRSRVRVDCDASEERAGPFWKKGLGTQCLRNVPTILYVETPYQTPADIYNEWFCEAIDVIGSNYTSVGDRLGRGTLDGFPLENMGVQVVYGALAAVPVDVGIAFRSRVDVPRMGQVLIIGPPELKSFGCVNKRGVLQPVSLGEIVSCESSMDPPTVRLTLNATLPAAQHALIVPGETSSKDPKQELNVFDIYLLHPDGRNLDVSLRVPGEPVQQGLRASVWPLWWTRPRRDESYSNFFVTVPLEVIDDVDVSVYGILITHPSYELYSDSVEVRTAFGETVFLEKDSIITGKDEEGLLKVIVRLDKTKRMRTGLSLIRFQIAVPEQPPLFNFWRVALCGDKMRDDTSGCSLSPRPREGRGDAVLAVFALAGFDPFDTGSGGQEFERAQIGSAERSTKAPAVALALLAASSALRLR